MTSGEDLVALMCGTIDLKRPSRCDVQNVNNTVNEPW